MKTILVTGGTGVLGRKVVAALQVRGVSPVVLSRKVHSTPGVTFVQGDLLDSSSLPQVLTNVEVIIHCATNPKKPKEDPTGTTNLLEAAKRAGVKHFVLISIVETDKMRWIPYYRAKFQQETLVAKSGIPYTILRAAQFHEFVVNLLTGLSRNGVQFLPTGFRTQPVQVEVVAAKLADAALSSPQGRLPDLAGPEVRSFVSLGKEWLAATKQNKRVVIVPVPGFIAKAWQPVGGATTVKTGESWSEWLRQHGGEENPYQKRS